jgi:putative RNA 2'-phosphotransferase
MSKQHTTISKFLSLVLRHQPETIGVTLDPEGWIAIDELLTAAAAHGTTITRELLSEVVASSDKQRFAISADGQRVRANQGHSVEVDLKLAPIAPPEQLFHGTVAKFLDSIRQSGLIKGQRQHVHLSADRPTAEKVGQRRGQPVILRIAAGRMQRDGHHFYRSENGVWLVDAVPVEYLAFEEWQPEA